MDSKRTEQSFSEPEIKGVYRAIRERRDMRHFLPDPLQAGQLERFIGAAHHAPSVGYMQPWRFVRIIDPGLKRDIYEHVQAERAVTACALAQREDEFMRLKVEGILSCAEVLIVSLVDGRERYVFGRRTMPEMDLASASCAIQNLWLAARAEGIGVGWVSLFDPEALRRLCGMPDGSKPIAILCIGHVKEFYPAPMLETERWDKRRPVESLLYVNTWGKLGGSDDEEPDEAELNAVPVSKNDLQG